MGGHHEGAFGTVPQVHDRADDLRDHVPGLAQDDGVADQHALAFDLVGVVQGGQGDGGAGDPDRLQAAERGDPPRAAHVDLDAQQPGGDLLGRVLVGHRPARGLRRGAEAALQAEGVDLHHHTVDLVLDVVAVLPPPADECLDLGDARQHLVVPGDRQAELGHPLVRIGLGGDVEAAVGTESMHDHGQWAAGGDPRVLLPQGAGGGVARVGERFVASGDQRGVEFGEGRRREEDLAADLQQLGHAPTAQPARHRREGPDVRGDVLSRPPVAAGGRARQVAVLVDQVDRETIDLQLAQPGVHLGLPGDAGGPRLELHLREDVVQREQPLQVLHRGEQRRDGAGDLLGRRVRRAQTRIAGLELRQLGHELVVLGVGDGRGIQDVVAEGVFAQLPGQLRRPRPRLCRDLVDRRRVGRVRGGVRAGGVERAHTDPSARARPASRQRRSATLA